MINSKDLLTKMFICPFYIKAAKNDFNMFDKIEKTVMDSVYNSVEDSIWDSFGRFVSDFIINSVWHSIRESVYNSVEDSIGNSVWYLIGEPIDDSIKNNLKIINKQVLKCLLK